MLYGNSSDAEIIQSLFPSTQYPCKEEEKQGEGEVEENRQVLTFF